MSNIGNAASGIAAGERHLLVVDDEEALRDCVGEMLLAAGYVVEACEDGEAGLLHFRLNHHRIDAVLLDMVMPRLGGHECLKQMRCIDPDVPVIVLSGCCADESMVALTGCGAFRVMAKPVSFDELRNTVHEAVRARKEGGAT